MSSEEQATPPLVLWAQRAPAILLTVALEDCSNPDIQIKPDSLIFSGVGGPDKKLHKVTINFYGEIDPEKSLKSVRDRNIEFVLKKKDDGPFWPRLTKEKIKYHWLKVDFSKWKEEDDSEDEGVGGFGGGEDDLEAMMKQMGGLRGAGDEKASMDDLQVDSEDSDDGDLPDLE